MAKKEQRVTIGKLESIMLPATETIQIEGLDANVIVKRTLSFDEMLQFVENVVSTCVDMDEGKYIPEAVHFMIKHEVLTKYANFNMPADISKKYELIYQTNVFDEVIEYINKKQFREIVESIDSKIAHRRTMAENMLASQLNDVVERMNAFADQTEAVFGDMSTKDMASIAQNLAQLNVMDEGKLVKAVLDYQDVNNAMPETVVTEK